MATPNLKIEHKGDVITITINVKKAPLTQSASGKTLTVASTQGNKEVGDTGIFIGVNAYKYPDKK